MVRYTAERQPVFICPKWFFSMAQPIAIRNVLDYLTVALNTPQSTGKLIEIGGATQLTYAQMLLAYSRERGLKRILIPFPFYIPRLSAYWVHMLTPLPWRLLLPLIEGLHSRSVVQNDLAWQLFPAIHWISRPPSTWRSVAYPTMMWRPPGAMLWWFHRETLARLR
jgi:hypothetical protein